MSHGNIRRIPRSCVSYHPGHRMHWIHAKKAHVPQPQFTVVVTVHDDGHVELDADDLHLRLWHHGPAWLQSVLGQAGHHGQWKPGPMRCSHRATADGYSISLPSIT